VNPLAWLLKRQIGENLEFIADATAKVQNTTGISYERTLLSSAASHMQPALANNFFTPFVKKRIQMLQKETSKTWNAYKYALILPVIVLFLYSFNTVTKTEYVESEMDVSSMLDESPEFDDTKSISQKKNNPADQPLIFDINANTTKAELESYRNQINIFANYNIKLERTVEEGSPMTIIAVDFDELKEEGSITSYPQEMDIKLLVEKNLLSIIDEESGSIIHASKDGISYESIKKEFVISSKTSQVDLNVYVDQINEFANYKIKLEKAKTENGITQLSVSTAFDIEAFDKKVVLPLSNKSSRFILLRVSKNQLKINDDFRHETYSIDSGTSLKMSKEDWTYNAKEANATKSFSENEQIRFTIPPTATKEGLQRIKRTLKTQYNVDFSYSNLTYKDGKIIKINIELDDKRGFKGSQNYSNNAAIPTICIVGVIEENKKSWSMGNCDDNRMSFNGSNKTMNNILGSIQDLNLTEMKVKMSEMDMDSLQLTLKKLQTDLLLFQDDEINLQLKARLVEAEKRLSKMNVDSMMFGDPNVTYSLGNVTYSNNDSIELNSNDIWAYQNKNSVKRMYGNKPPLFILNGVEVKQEAFEKLSPKNIELVSVLKDESATSLYGDKGKNGVVIITTKVNPKTYSNALFVVNGKAVDKDIFSKMKPETIESVRILKDKNATSLWGEKGTNGVVVVTTKTDIKNAVMPLYIVNGKEMSEKEFKKLDVHRLKSISVLKDAKATSKYGDKSKNGVIEVELKTDAEMKKQPVNSNDLEEVIVTGYSTSTSTSIDFFTITIDDFKDSELAELKSTLKNLDHDFELKTFRKNGENVTKLKFDLDGTTYTYEPKNGMKIITIKMEDSSKTPKVSAVTY
jgi:TonB-dependent SusC/RagA subfamily outer membrane receptor